MDEKRNFTLLTDFYELTMMQGYFREKADDIVVFDAFYRKIHPEAAMRSLVVWNR